LRRLPPDAGLLRHQELPGGRAQLLPPRRHLPGLQALLLLLGHATAPVEWEERGVREETHTHTHTHTHTFTPTHTHSTRLSVSPIQMADTSGGGGPGRSHQVPLTHAPPAIRGSSHARDPLEGVCVCVCVCVYVCMYVCVYVC